MKETKCTHTTEVAALIALLLLTILAVTSTFFPIINGEAIDRRAHDRGQPNWQEGLAQSQAKGTQKEQTLSKGPRLRSFEFEVVTVNASGRLVDKHKNTARLYVEDLGGGVTIEMVEIPAGTFLMGTAYTEAEEVVKEYKRYFNDDTKIYGEEYVPEQIPQHSVTVPAFSMGRFEVTQAQWRAVAALPKVVRDLAPDPSFFKADDLPVESVSWQEAVEFCDRLSRVTGRRYRLPSEAEWEYACRAGTATQFHFGNAITAALVNYRSDYPYGSAPTETWTERSVPVGSLRTANAFGLCDMHGNVEEWCLDLWHENYNIAPRDGSVWEFRGDPNVRVVRGGSWTDMAAYCRSSFRIGMSSTRTNYRVGFRVVCFFGRV